MVTGGTKQYPYTTGDGGFDRLPRGGGASQGGNTGGDYFSSWFWNDVNRFWINPFGQQPSTAQGDAQRSQLLLPGASNFIVEYAGDYFEQNPLTGEIADQDGDGVFVGPDGVIDFIVTPSNARVIRFYGFPRDVDGNGFAELYFDGMITMPGAYTSTDVLPLKDMVGFTGVTLGVTEFGAPLIFPHEKRVPIDGRLATYGDSFATTPAPYVTTGQPYLCAWSPAEINGKIQFDGFSGGAAGTPDVSFDFPLGPKLIRFVVTATDPEGRLETPITSEFVFEIPDN